MLLMHCIDTSLNVRHVDVEVCTNGWPEDEKTLDDADSIVLLCDGAMKVCNIRWCATIICRPSKDK